jgi:hypothetical protein
MSARGPLVFRACATGAAWPERTVDRAVGRGRRTTDFYHTTEPVRVASIALPGGGPASLRWYR